MKMAFILIGYLFSMMSYGQEQFVNVSGHNYHVLLKGFEHRASNVPVLIFESGMGVDLGNWDKIIDSIANFAPVFVYDRAGIGKSDITYELPTPKLVSDNLHSILKKLAINPPYILIGHSLGGVYVRSFAGIYANEIAGLVFIDPADFTETKNDWNNIFRQMGVPEKKIDDMMYNRLYTTSKIDSSNFGVWSEGHVLKDLRRTDFADVSNLTLPNVPIYFLVGGKFEVPIELRSKDFDHVSFFHIKNNYNMQRWKNLIYSSSKGGTLIYLTNAGHYIHRDDPKSVINSIKFLVESIKE